MLPTPSEAIAVRRQAILASPVALLVPVALALGIVGLGHDLRPLAIGVGVVGWILAYALRAPIALILQRRGDTRPVNPWLVAASGPTEELVRLAAILILGRELDTALSIGLGWAAIECVYSVVSTLALSALLTRDDEEAVRIRQTLPPPPGGFTPSGPWWGVWERVWASGLHLGFSAIIAAQPLLVVLTIPLHSATNLLSLQVIERFGLARMELLGAAWAALIIGVAAALWAGLG